MVNIEEGVYIIRCVGNNEVLDLSNGTWSYGRVQTWQATSGGITSEGGWNQTWLLARVIGTNDEWHIINLHYGVQVGVFATERNITRSFTVKAAPTRHSAWSTRWIIKDEGNSQYRFVWKMDGGKSLDITGNQSHGEALAYPTGNGPNQLFKLERQDYLDPKDRSWCSWMSRIPNNKRISELSIPMTHQSISLHTIDSGKGNNYHTVDQDRGVDPMVNPQCQTRSPYEQLCDGIRGMDCRFDTWTQPDEENCLFSVHGVANMGYSGCALFQSLKVFLQRFSSETIFVTLVNERKDNINFASTFQKEFEDFRSIFVDGVQTFPYTRQNVELSKLRGKICVNY